MAESKMVTTAATRLFIDGCISEDVQSSNLCKYAKFHASMMKGTKHLKFDSNYLDCFPSGMWTYVAVVTVMLTSFF